jgi:hypothetical protein
VLEFSAMRLMLWQVHKPSSCSCEMSAEAKLHTAASTGNHEHWRTFPKSYAVLEESVESVRALPSHSRMSGIFARREAMITINCFYIQASSASLEEGFSLIYSSCQKKQELICFNQIFCFHVTSRSFLCQQS